MQSIPASWGELVQNIITSGVSDRSGVINIILWLNR